MESLLAPLVQMALLARDYLVGRRPDNPAEARPPAVDPATLGVSFHYLTASDGCRLFCRYWLPEGYRSPRWVLLCVHGAGAHGAHFEVVAKHLCPAGAAVYALDLRGHGLSGGRRGDLTAVDRILQDLWEMLAFLRQAHPCGPLYLWGESAGAPYAIKYAAERGQSLDGLILSSPELESAVKPSLWEYLHHLPRAILDPDARIVDLSGRLHLCNRESSDVQRELTDPLRNNRLDSRSVLALYRLSVEASRLGERIALPTLILQGGGDLVSDPRAVKGFFRRLSAKDKRLALFPEAYHGLLHDPDTPLVLAEAENWLREH